MLRPCVDQGEWNLLHYHQRKDRRLPITTGERNRKLVSPLTIWNSTGGGNGPQRVDLRRKNFPPGLTWSFCGVWSPRRIPAVSVVWDGSPCLPKTIICFGLCPLTCRSILLKKNKPAWLSNYFLSTAGICLLLLLTWPILPQFLNYFLIPFVATLLVRSMTLFKLLKQAV
jgi:hypothetical protein